MNSIKIKGIVLKTIPFKDKQKILTLFSKELGICSVLMKRISPKTAFFSDLFCEGEFILLKKNSDLLIFQEGSAVNLHLSLRENFKALQTAGTLSQAILSSQLPGKSSPLLYALFVSFLNQLHLQTNYRALVACFYLKMLLAEGTYCADAIDQESSFCLHEKQLLKELISLKKFSSLHDKLLLDDTFQKLENIFQDTL